MPADQLACKTASPDKDTLAAHQQWPFDTAAQPEPTSSRSLKGCGPHRQRIKQPTGELTRPRVAAIINHMVKSVTRQLDETFFALSDPIRRRMLARLAAGDMTVGHLAEPFKVSAPAISRHLRVLERAGLLTRQREGRIRRCHLVPVPLKDAAEWVQQYRQFWETQLDQLAEYLENSVTPEPPPKRTAKP
jgi:DNA-binding transcriptional ArsR family regulator